jgi:hypothetical protein
LPDTLKLPRSIHAYVERRLTLLEAFVADLIMIRAAHLHRTQARVRDRAFALCAVPVCRAVRARTAG